MRAIDLFAGAGGLSLGLQQAGIEVVAAVEWDTDACATYRANVGDHMIERSILDVSPDDLPDCDLMAGGPPCQGFSFAGKRDKDDPRNALWREYWRLVQAKRPAFIVIENVRGMLAMGEDKPLILAFADLGYRVTPYLLNAADYGVPQRRFRVFYIGNRLGLPNPCPTATHAQPPRHLLLGLEPWVTVRQALGIGGHAVSATLRSGVHGLPGYSPRHEAGYVFADPDEWLDQPSVAIRGANGGSDLSADGTMRATCKSRRPMGWIPDLPNIPLDAPSPTIQGGGSDTGGAEPVRHRLRGRASGDGDGATFDEPAPTVSADRGLEEHSETTMMLRRLTPRECATLQDFPADFQFHGTKTSQYRQIGNAVPPGMARAIGLAIRAVLENASVDVA